MKSPKIDMKLLVISFMIGSSLFVALPTLTYFTYPYVFVDKNTPIPKSSLFLIMLMYGIGTCLLAATHFSTKMAYLIGAFIGFVMSLLGSFIWKYPELIGMENKSIWLVHVIAPILYAFIFRLYVLPVTKFLMSI